jgi:4-amino-4-deoxy-L-arabinose transferase-like glycosyltransferase
MDNSRSLAQGSARHRGFLIILLALVALNVAKAAAFIAAGQGPLQGDSVVYWSLGERAAAGNWLLLDDPPEVTRTPAYPYFVAFFQATFGRRALAAAIITQHLLLLGTVALAAWTCWLLTRKRSSVLLCLALTLACFSCWGVAVNLLSDTLLSFLLALGLALAVAWRQSPSPWKAAALGLVFGAAVLTKPVAQFAGLIVVGWMLAGGGNALSWRKRAVDCTLAVAAAMALVTPWLVRNEICFGQPFLARFAGRSLWWSCFKDHPETRAVDPPIPFADGPATRTVLQTVTAVSPHDTWPAFKELVRRHGYSEIAADDLMLEGAKEAIRAHPDKYLLSRCRRYVWFWLTPHETYRPNTDGFSFPFENDDQGQATWRAKWYFQEGGLNFLWYPHTLVYGLAVLACAASIVTLAVSPGTRGAAVFFALWLGYFSVVTTLFGCPAYRYRMILEPAMIVLAVLGWEALRAMSASRRSGKQLSPLPPGEG